MRYPATEKLEIIRLVEHSPLLVRDTLAKLGIPRATFYRWYDRYRQGGSDALADRVPRAERVWNRIPQAVRDSVIQLALDEPPCRRASWRPASPTRGTISSQRLRCTACSRRET